MGKQAGRAPPVRLLTASSRRLKASQVALYQLSSPSRSSTWRCGPTTPYNIYRVFKKNVRIVIDMWQRCAVAQFVTGNRSTELVFFEKTDSVENVGALIANRVGQTRFSSERRALRVGACGAFPQCFVQSPTALVTMTKSCPRASRGPNPTPDP